MSTQVDSKVVEMRFDNKQFESNVQTSLSTIDKLKRSLRLAEGAKGFENVSAAAKKCDMSGLNSAVENISNKFSAFGIMGVTALANITNSAVNAGKRIVSALTIDPIKSGFEEYETKMGSIQTIMSNTASKGTTMEDVTRVIGELNTYADKTIYNFAEMTRNIGTFTAAGIGLEESATAIQGIANLAAVSGSNSQQASTAMYQLSQAMAAGTVKLQDWNSVVNAGMGGQVFQDALKATAKAHGVAVDDIIKKNGSFRESLQDGWITTEILTETLSKMTKSGAAEYLSGLTGVEQKQIEAAQKLVAENKDGTASYEELAAQLASTGKISKDEAMNILKMADNAEDAATKVKTFTQLWDTLKESAQSGWSQSWEIIVGDFEEAKELFTEVSDTIGAMIGASADARNKVLQGWKDLGGRTAIIDAFRNAFNGVLSIAKPISEAFREIFPPATAEQLVSFSEKLRDLTAKLKIGEKTASVLKNAFKGVFSVVKIGINFVTSLAEGAMILLKAILPIGEGLLSLTGSFGGFITKISEATSGTNLFVVIFEKIASIIAPIANGIKKALFTASDGVDKFGGIIGVLQKVASGITTLFNKIKNAVSGDSLGFNSLFDAVNGGLLAGILFGIMKFMNSIANGSSGIIKTIKGVFESLGDSFEGVADILDGVGGALQAWQQNLQANTLLKIAGAVGILALSLKILSTIDPEKMGSALTAITVLFAELFISMSSFAKMAGGKGLKSVGKLTRVMLGMSVSVLILASAMKKIAELSWDQILKGLSGVGVLMLELVAVSKMMKGTKMVGASVGIIAFATGLLILSSAVEKLGSLNIETLKQGLISVGILIAEISAMSAVGGTKGLGVGKGAGLILFAAGIIVLAEAVERLGNLSPETLGKGLLSMAGALAIVAGAVALIPKSIAITAAGLIGVSAALVILSQALSTMGGMTWEEIGKGLVTLAGALTIIAVAMNFMTTALPGAAALLVVASSLAILTPVLLILGNMSWEGIAKGLVTIAGAFTIIGIAGLVLTPVIPAILGFAAAVALLGVGCLAAGVGILALGTGIAALAVAFTAAGATIIAAITSLINLIPVVATAIGVGIVQLVTAIGNGSVAIVTAVTKILTAILQAVINVTPKLTETIIVLLDAILAILVDAVPKMVDAGMKIIIGFLEGIAQNIGGVTKAAVDIIVNFLESLGKQLPRIVDAGFKMMIDFINGLCDSIEANTPKLASAIKRLITTVLKAAVTLIVGSIPDFVKSGVKIFTGFITGLKNKVSDISKTVKNAVKSAAKKAKECVSDFIKAGADVIGGFIKGIKSKITNAANAAADVGKSALNSIKNFLGINSPSRAFAEIGMGVVEGFDKGIHDNVGDAVKASVGLGTSVLNAFTDFFKINSPSLVMKENGEYIVDGLAEGITDDMSAEDAAARKARNVVDAFQKEYDKYDGRRKTSDLTYSMWEKTFGKTATEAEKLDKQLDKLASDYAIQRNVVHTAKIQHDMTGTTESLNRLLTEQNALQDIYNEVEEIINSEKYINDILYEDYAKHMSDMAKAFPNFSKETLESMARDATGYDPNSIGNKTVEDILGTFANVSPEFKTVGESYAASVGEGVRSETSQIVEPIGNLVTACADNMSSQLPDWTTVATNLVDGFIQTIKDNTLRVAAETTNMIKTAYSAASFAVSALSSSGYAPSIKPVLDMSELQNGTNVLNGLLANRSVTLATEAVELSDSVLADLSGVADKIRKSNEIGHSNIVSAIANLRNDIHDLAEAIDNMNITMDGDTVVGKLSGRIDNTLGRIVMQKGRRN